jgi:hypothetical protein
VSYATFDLKAMHIGPKFIHTPPQTSLPQLQHQAHSPSKGHALGDPQYTLLTSKACYSLPPDGPVFWPDTAVSASCRGSHHFVDAEALDKGFLVNDTLCISVLPLLEAPKFSQTSLGGKRAFSLVDQVEKAPMSAKSTRSNRGVV